MGQNQCPILGPLCAKGKRTVITQPCLPSVVTGTSGVDFLAPVESSRTRLLREAWPSPQGEQCH